jgi:hypothetical protein
MASSRPQLRAGPRVLSINYNRMASSELTALLERAEHLLWVIARHDVESLSGSRTDVLRRLGDLEMRALQWGVTDLYGEILREGPGLTKIVL